MSEPHKERYWSRKILGAPVAPHAMKFLIKKGITKSEKHAYYILVGTTIICFVLSAVIIGLIYYYHLL